MVTLPLTSPTVRLFPAWARCPSPGTDPLQSAACDPGSKEGAPIPGPVPDNELPHASLAALRVPTLSTVSRARRDSRLVTPVVGLQQSVQSHATLDGPVSFSRPQALSWIFTLLPTGCVPWGSMALKVPDGIIWHERGRACQMTVIFSRTVWMLVLRSGTAGQILSKMLLMSLAVSSAGVLSLAAATPGGVVPFRKIKLTSMLLTPASGARRNGVPHR